MREYDKNMCATKNTTASPALISNLILYEGGIGAGVKAYKKVQKSHQENQKRICRSNLYLSENMNWEVSI
jgi:hypothetical protein